MSGHFLSDQTAWSDQGHSLTHRALSTPTMSRLTAAAILMIALGVAAHSGGESCCHVQSPFLRLAVYLVVYGQYGPRCTVVALTSPRTILLLQECQHAHKASAPPPSQRTQCASCCAKEKVRTHASARCDSASSALSHERPFSAKQTNHDVALCPGAPSPGDPERRPCRGCRSPCRAVPVGHRPTVPVRKGRASIMRAPCWGRAA